MDTVQNVHDQIARLRKVLAEWQRRNGEFAEEIDRLGANDSRMRIELDRLKRDMDKWRTTASDLQRQLIEARTELGAKTEECRRLPDELQPIKEMLAAIDTQDGWRQRLDECRNESWRLQREAGVLRNVVDSKAGELDALREEVRKARFAESNQRERAKDIEEELARVRLASIEKESEEDAAIREALPFLFEHVKYLKDLCPKPCDKRRPYPGHCPFDSSRIHWRYYYLLCFSVGEHQWAYLVKVLGVPSWRPIEGWRLFWLNEMGWKDDICNISGENLA
jgi:chromosome segregation ATPase